MVIPCTVSEAVLGIPEGGLRGGVQSLHGTEQSVPVSLTGLGIPRIIPAHHRRRILLRDSWADCLVVLYLSFFTFYTYTIVYKAKRLTRATFKTIKEPVSYMDSVLELMSEIKTDFMTLVRRYVPSISEIPLNQGMLWEPRLKTLPSYMALKKAYGPGGLFSEKAP